VTTLIPLMNLLQDLPDPRRAEGKLYKLPHVLLFAILAIVSGSNSYRGIVTFISCFTNIPLLRQPIYKPTCLSGCTAALNPPSSCVSYSSQGHAQQWP